jgi:hypothetical protein
VRIRCRDYVWCCALAFAGAAQADAGLKTAFHFATTEEGRAIVSTRDDYIERLSPLERALKAKSEVPVSETEFLSLLAATVKPWSAADQAAVQSALTSVAPAIAQLGLPLPRSVTFVRTGGHGEGNAPHTRANTIIITDSALKQQQDLPTRRARAVSHCQPPGPCVAQRDVRNDRLRADRRDRPAARARCAPHHESRCTPSRCRDSRRNC